MFDKVTSTATRLFGKASLKAQKHSPEALLVVGIIGVVGTAVLASRATLKIDSVLDVAKNKIDRCDQAREAGVTENGLPYSEEDYRKDKSIIWVQNALALAKLYSPAIIVGGVTIGCFIGSHKMMSGRVLALGAAYKVLEDQFEKYRNRVVDEYGDETDHDFAHGVVSRTVEQEQNSEGKITRTRTIQEVDGLKCSQYAKYFDESNINWSSSPEYNLNFLRAAQRQANDTLNARGHIFLNEVYDILGLPRTQAGTITGWTLNKNADGDFVGDGYVDFGIYELLNDGARDFINGYVASILLDFNVDGVIWEAI